MDTVTRQRRIIENQDKELFVLRMVFYITIGAGVVFPDYFSIPATALLCGYCFYRYAMWRKRQKDEKPAD